MATSTTFNESTQISSSIWGDAINSLRGPSGSLSSFFTGDLVFPDSADYTKAIDRWVGSSVKAAGVVAYPRTNEDVSALVKWAAKEKIEVVVCGGGHSPGGDSSTSGGLVIDLGRYIKSVVVDATNKTAVVGGGARFKPLEKAVEAFNLAVATPSFNEVGVGGFSLVGGLGLLMGATSLAVDKILAATVIIASGEIVQVDAESHADLYWAIRGGGGGFGVVTSFTFRLHDQRPTVAFGTAMFTADQLPTLLPKINKWLEIRTPEETAALNFVVKDGTHLILVLTIYNGDVDVGQQRFGDILETAFVGKEMREIATSEMGTQLDAFLLPGKTKYQTSSLLSELSEDTVTALYEKLKAAQHGSDPGVVDVKLYFFLHSWELASRVDPDATPFFNRAKNQIFVGAEIEYTPGNYYVARDFATEVRRISGSESGYAGFETELDEDVRLRATFGDKNLRRLREVKRKYDPERVFRSWFC